MALPVEVVMIWVKLPSMAETPFLNKAKVPITTKGREINRVTKYGRRRLNGCEKLYTVIVENFVALVAVRHVP